MLRKFIFSAAAVAAFTCVKAQDSTAPKPTLAVSGYVDAYYRFNLGNPKKETEATNNFTSFTNSQNSFELNMASVKLEHSFGKVGAVADLGFGKRAEEFSYNDENTNFIIKQAYLTYSPAANVKLTAGSWATHVGYELVDPILNRNYSMSYMFSYGPFFHTGVKADVSLGKSAFMLGFANPTDLKSADFSRKFMIAQYSLSAIDDKLKMYVNYQGGKPGEGAKMNQFDLTVSAAVSSKFSMGYNGTVQSVKTKDPEGKFGDSNSWWGSAVYLNLDPTEAFGLTLRSEYFSNKKAVVGAPEAGIFANTLSANFRVGPLTFIPELRIENASTAIYTKGADIASKKSTASALVAAVYKF
ncbi:Putative beta-barrel porin-2, OmpL-like. bbp2 [Cnuella takakiae]|uniref:Putative beta-barrel porin-2, OmpL-like. bbp2 n=1 Tax=Cnuella takakiae TaxID=1302690 RepID=A0A1M4ZW42_9BACT|nr:outer membrane beta-barrel protein [Cnuella takakiae]OLY92182.1 hypothetical protein BUE76_09965 [Cnuella takakiae]SHF22238.1 Putative beta-barrel porin-2, OmpL-like. bbp2 [Cnuella takakiae]